MLGFTNFSRVYKGGPCPWALGPGAFYMWVFWVIWPKKVSIDFPSNSIVVQSHKCDVLARILPRKGFSLKVAFYGGL